MVEQSDNAARGGGQKARGAFKQSFKIFAGETVGVLFWINGFDNFGFVESRRERQLDNNTVDLRIAVAVRDSVDQLALACRVRELPVDYSHADFLGEGFFVFDVSVGAREIAHLDDEQGGDAPEFFDLPGEFFCQFAT